jgi:integrase
MPAVYQAVVSVVREGKRIPVRKHFDQIKAACQWRQDASSQARAGKLPVPTRTTLWEAGQELDRGDEDGRIYDRSGRPYKPSTIRGYEMHLRTYILPALGGQKLSSITRRDLQRLQGEPQKLSASTLDNIACPLQVIFGRALHDELLAVDPTLGLRLPAAPGKRDRIASPEEARDLLDALPEFDRALWATAFYGSARRAELRALRCSDVDLDRLVIRLERGWDDKEGEQSGKSDAARRTVPIIQRLASILDAHLRATGRTGDDLLFGRSAGAAVHPSTIRNRALEAWGWTQVCNPERELDHARCGSRPARTRWNRSGCTNAGTPARR